MSEENTTPQEPQKSATDTDALGDAGKKALEAERAARKEAAQQVRELQAKIEQFEDANRSEVERATRKADKLSADLEAAQARIAQYEHQALISEVAAEVGIPREAAHRLQGSTREELLKDAEALKALLAPEGPRKPAPVAEAGQFTDPKRSNDQVFAEFFSQNFN